MVVVTSTSTLALTETEEAAVRTDTDSIEGDDVVEQSPAVVSSGDQGPDEPEPVNSTTTEPELDESSTDAVTDLTVADLVADHRAATPTAAIVALLPDRDAERQGLVQRQSR